MRRDATAAAAAAPAAARGERRTPPASRGQRLMAFEAISYDPATRLADCIFSIGSRVERSWYTEELAIDAGSVRLDRVATNLVRLLFSHDEQQPIGAVVSASIENGRLIGQVRFNETPAGDLYAGMVQRGEITGLSVGYLVHQWTITSNADAPRDDWRATDWELLEVSLVAIPADPNAGIRSAEPAPIDPGQEAAVLEGEPEVRRSLTGGAPATAVEIPAVAAAAAAPVAEAVRAAEPVVAAVAAAAVPAVAAAAPAAEAPAAAGGLSAADALAFAEQARSFGVDTEVRSLLLAPTTTPEAASRGILEAAARRQAADTAPAGTAGVGMVRGGLDETVTRREGMEEFILHRYRPSAYQMSDRAREFRGMTLMDMARESCEWRGDRTRGMTPTEVCTRALMSTSDFPLILANVTNRTLRDAYLAAERTFMPLARQVTLTDFKTAHRVQLSEAPQLLQLTENGEFKRGSLTEGDETIKLLSYGRVIGVTRQTIINDDLGAFTRIPQLWGNAVAMLEGDIMWKLLLSNPTLATDNKAVFHAAHGNYIATGGAAPAIDTVSTGRTAMSKQTGLDGKSLIVARAKFLVVPEELLTQAEQLTTSIVPVDITKTVPDSIKRLQPISDPRLSVGVGTQAGSTTAWYLAADPNLVDGLEYAYLEGQEGPYTESRIGFDVDGVEYKVRHDFGAAMIDFRGWFKNVGA